MGPGLHSVQLSCLMSGALFCGNHMLSGINTLAIEGKLLNGTAECSFWKTYINLWKDWDVRSVDG